MNYCMGSTQDNAGEMVRHFKMLANIIYITSFDIFDKSDSSYLINH